MVWMSGFIAGYILASILLGRKKFVVKTSEKGEVTIEQANRPKRKVEFISEPTRQDVEEAEKPKGLKRFLKGFAKPAKEEEEEEI